MPEAFVSSVLRRIRSCKTLGLLFHSLTPQRQNIWPCASEPKSCVRDPKWWLARDSSIWTAEVANFSNLTKMQKKVPLLPLLGFIIVRHWICFEQILYIEPADFSVHVFQLPFSNTAAEISEQETASRRTLWIIPSVESAPVHALSVIFFVLNWIFWAHSESLSNGDRVRGRHTTPIVIY